ncbi:MAG: ABC transporter ATP-binding protein [Candidatus Margulisiibacteriota bacterium]|nr:ABC transporter ATP-binding protein [Candidatus Margulisiibacteriota bacterium]
MTKKGLIAYLKPVIPFLKPYWLTILASLLCTALYALSNVYIMPLVKDISREISNKNFNYFTNHVFNASILFFIRLSSKYLQIFIMERASYKVMLDIRLKLYKIIHFLPSDIYNNQKHGDLTSRILDDCDKIRRAIFLNFESFLPNVLTIFGVTGYLIYLCWPLALLSLVGAPIFIFTLTYFSKRLRKVSKQLQQNTADFTQMIQESLANMKILQIYTAEEKNINQFNNLQKRYMSGYLKEVKFRITREQIDAYSQYLIFLVIIWFGGYLSLKDIITTSQLLSFFTGIVILVEPIIVMTKIYAETFKVTASIDRVDYLLQYDLAPITEIKETRLEFNTIEFKNVSFNYPGSNNLVLKNLNFTFNQGDFIGIVGPSGAGKSTIVSLLAKYYDVKDGLIFVDGIPLPDVSNTRLRENIAYVPQESLLFKSTILDNCRIGRPSATISDVIDALKLANAWEFVEKLPDKLLTKIGTQGLTLSGGQRQRLSIARAIVSQPKLLILDEATSALDSQSEQKIQEAIQSLKGKFTMIIIAHRMSTIKDASNIFVIDKGEIIETGSHQLLFEQNGIYRNLVDTQSMTK